MLLVYNKGIWLYPKDLHRNLSLILYTCSIAEQGGRFEQHLFANTITSEWLNIALSNLLGNKFDNAM